MIRRFSLLTSLTILFVFLLEIFFVYHLPELYASSRVAVVEYTTVSGTVIPHAPLPSDRRKTAPEIRKYTQNTFRYVFAIPQYLVPYIPGGQGRSYKNIDITDNVLRAENQGFDQRIWIRKISKHLQVIPESSLAY